MTLLYDPVTKNLVESMAQSAPKYGLLVPNRLFVGGLGAEITEADLRSFFSSYGPIKHCKIMSDNNGMSKGYGFVTFVSAEDVEKLLKKEGEQLIYKDRKLNIGPAVRKQAVLPQVLGNNPTAGGQCGIIYANGVPCFVQGPAAPMMSPASPASSNPASAVLPVQEAVSYPHLVSLPTGGVQMMMLQPQYFAQPTALMHTGTNASQQQGSVTRGPIQYANALPFHLDPTTGLPQVYTASANTGTSTAALLHSIAQQQQQQQQLMQQQLPHQLLLSTASANNLGLEQYIYQLPYMIQQQQQQALLQQQFQASDVLGQPITTFEILQQKLQQQQNRQLALAATAEGLSSQVHYIEIPRAPTPTKSSTLTNTTTPPAPPQPLSASANAGLHLHSVTASTMKSSIDPSTSAGQTKSVGMKRVLSIPHQTVCPPSYAGGVYGLPAVKILAGQGQQRIVTQVLSDTNDVQVLAKNLQ